MAQPIVGLIAGAGLLPILVARGIRAAGHRVACIGLGTQYDAALPSQCDQFATAGVIRIGRWIRLLRRWGVRDAVMIGRVRKARMYEPTLWLRQLPDLRAGLLWYRILRHDRRDQTVLTAVADELSRHGIELIDSTHYISDHLADAGNLTHRRLSGAQQADLDFGWPVLLKMVGLDVGQSIAVKDRDIIAVEAIEGTDAMIHRAGELCRSGGWMLLKGARPEKDMRFDVPTVGIQTIVNLKQAGVAALVLAAGKVILADKPRVLAAAEDARITVVGV